MKWLLNECRKIWLICPLGKLTPVLSSVWRKALILRPNKWTAFLGIRAENSTDIGMLRRLLNEYHFVIMYVLTYRFNPSVNAWSCRLHQVKKRSVNNLAWVSVNFLEWMLLLTTQFRWIFCLTMIWNRVVLQIMIENQVSRCTETIVWSLKLLLSLLRRHQYH